MIGRLLYPERFGRPRTRADCKDLPRPCPFVGCQFNLYLDVTPLGTIRWNYGCEPWEMASSCARDAADEGGMTLEETGAMIGITRERVRQLETAALERLAAMDGNLELPMPPGASIWERMGGA